MSYLLLIFSAFSICCSLALGNVNQVNFECTGTDCFAKEWNFEEKNMKITMGEVVKVKKFTIESQNIKSIPNLKIFNEMEHLEVINSNLEEIGANDFSEMKNLASLTITKNKIIKIDENSLNELEGLKILNLNENNLISLPAKIFNNLLHLEIIHLENNKIDEIDGKLFSKNAKLQYVSLSNNNLKTLHVLTFFSNPELNELHFHNNKIKHLFDKMFEKLEKLSKVDFSNNELESVDKKIFEKSPNLKIMNFEENSCVKKSFEDIATFMAEIEGSCKYESDVKKVWAESEVKLFTDEDTNERTLLEEMQSLANS